MNQANPMDDIVLGWSSTSNALLVYNPRNKKFYEPDSYCIDPHQIPGAVYHDLQYDGGLFCYLKQQGPVFQDKTYPSGTQVD